MLRERLGAYLEDRLPVVPIREFFRKILGRRIPDNVGFWHALGFAAIFAIGIQFLTGLLLLCYYRPSTKEAHSAVQWIMSDVRFGWFIRRAHAFGASMVVAILGLHLTRIFVTGAYKKPREFTWVAGYLLFILALAMGFTGYLLPWSQVSYWGTMVATQSIGTAPVVGPTVMHYLRGGTDVTELTLNRFFAGHVTILPSLLIAILAIHVALMLWRNFAPSTPVGQPEQLGKRRFWPEHGLTILSACFLTLGVWVTLVLVAPMHDMGPANPLNTPHGIKPEWYFLPVFQLTKVVPEAVAFVLINAGLALFILWPFVDAVLDRSGQRSPGRRKLVMAIGILALLVVVTLGVLGYLSESQMTIFGKLYRFNTYGMPISSVGGGG